MNKRSSLSGSRETTRLSMLLLRLMESCITADCLVETKGELRKMRWLTAFPGALFRRFNELIRRGEIYIDEELTRFIYESSKLRKDGTVKRRAFKPDRDRETSVFCLAGMTHDEKKSHENLHGRPGKAPKAYATTSVHYARHIGLSVFHARPPPKHAAIRGWPIDEELELQKTQELAAHVNDRKSVVLI